VNSQLFDFFVHAAKNTGYLLNKRLEHPTDNLAVMTVNNVSEIVCTIQNYWHVHCYSSQILMTVKLSQMNFLKIIIHKISIHWENCSMQTDTDKWKQQS